MASKTNSIPVSRWIKISTTSAQKNSLRFRRCRGLSKMLWWLWKKTMPSYSRAMYSPKSCLAPTSTTNEPRKWMRYASVHIRTSSRCTTISKVKPAVYASRWVHFPVVYFGVGAITMTDWFARPVLHVTDVAASLRFYVDRLGFTNPWRYGGDKIFVAQVDRQGCALILCSQWPEKVGKGLMFISLNVEPDTREGQI